MLKRNSAHFLFLALFVFGLFGVVTEAVAKSVHLYPVKSRFFSRKPMVKSDVFLEVSRAEDYVGYYFMTGTGQALKDLPSGCRFQLDYMRPGKAKMRTKSFPIGAVDSKRVYLGLTGRDWRNPRQKPVYWRLRLIDPQGTVLADQQNIKIKTVTTGLYEHADAFKHISEYFTGKENTFYRTVIRSSAEERTGFYLILKLNQSLARLPKGSQLVLHYITSVSADTKEHVFALPEDGGSEVYLGLTGQDWEKGAKLISWEAVLKNSMGQELLSETSFLFNQVDH